MKAVIIAAGNGSRLWPHTNMTPKTLLPFGDGTILSTIMHNIAEAGINEFVFILGFKAKLVTDYLDQNHSFGFDTTIIYNNMYNRGNGLSVLLSEQALDNQNFLLSMSDHIVTAKSIERIICSDCDKNLLLVDKRIDSIVDPDDATKVWIEDDRIIQISKNLTEYNGIDCGIFRLTSHFFKAMREQEKNGNETISAAVEILIKHNDMHAVFIHEDEKWIDIDTPDIYHYALSNY
jgi:choline kinase